MSAPGDINLGVTTPTALTWRPALNLPGAEIRIADVNRPLTAEDSWSTTLGAHLYVLAGRDTTDQQVSGYIGISHALTTGRPWDSLTRWVRTQHALDAQTIALVRFTDEPELDALRILEARIIRGTTSAGVYTYNSTSSAPTATRALGAAGERVAMFGDLLERVLRFHSFGGARNDLMTPANTLRESAVRVVLGSKAALDTAGVLEGLERIGVRYGGVTQGASCRRDLQHREVGTAGEPRIRTTHVGSKAVYYPRAMSKSLAIARYTAAQARPFPA